MNFRTLILIACCTTLGLYGCGKDSPTTDSNTCNLSDPVINTTWVQQIISDADCVLYKGATLSTCTYKGATHVYMENLASSLGICVKALYDCSGKKNPGWNFG